MFILVSALVAASLVPGDACNNTTYTVVSPPGKQPGTVQTQGCAQGNITIGLQLSVEGGVMVVDASATGSVTATIQSPATCVSSYVWHSAEIHECGTELLDFHCNPKHHIVRVKYFENNDPCPDTTDLLALVQDYAEKVVAGNPFTIPLDCKELADATATLDSIAKARNSAGIIGCAVDVGDGPPQPPQAPQWQEFGSQIYVDVSALPTPFEINSFIPDGSLVDGVFAVHVGGGLVPSAPALPVILQDVKALHGPMVSANDLQCDVELLTWLPDEDGALLPHRDSSHLSGDFWAGGDFSIDRFLSVLTVDDDGRDQVLQFAERWTRSVGDVFHAQSGLEAGTVYPSKNGAATLIAASEIRDGQFLSEWVADPFGLEVASGSPFVEVVTGGSLRTLRQVRHNGRVEFSVDDSAGVPRVATRDVFDLSGVLTRRVTYGRYTEVALDVWRPMMIRVDDLSPSGLLTRSREYSLHGRQAVLAAAPTLEYPQPTLGRWTIWAQ